MTTTDPAPPPSPPPQARTAARRRVGAQQSGPAAASHRSPDRPRGEGQDAAPGHSPSPATELAGLAASAGLRVLARGGWPEEGDGNEVPALAGFVGSSFSPLVAEAARRCLGRRTGAPAAGTGIVVVSALGDLAGAVQVAAAVDGGASPGPLAFFQAVPNAVAGLVAARWGLDGPVVCVTEPGAGVEVAGVLIEDGDAGEVLLVRVEQAAGAGERDRAEAVLLSGGE